MTYSTTYLAQLAQFISIGLALANISVDPQSLETTLSVVATIISGLGVLYGRYQAGGVTALGLKK